MADALTSKPQLVRFKQACDELGMHTDSGYAHVKAGTFPIPVVTVGSIYKVRRSDLDAFLKGDTPSDIA